MSQKQNKRDQYIYEILKYCYYRKRENLITNGHYSMILYIENILSQFPREDRIFSKAAMNVVLNHNFLSTQNTQYVKLTPYGVIHFEETYNPTGIIQFSSLISPFLNICYNLYENNEKISHVDDFIKILQEKENILLRENEHWEVLHMLHYFGWITVWEGLGGIMEYMGITSEGVNHYLDETPPNIIETILNSNVDKFLHLDYFSKDKKVINETLFDWVKQFLNEEDKKCAAFLIENLWIVQNQWCINKFDEFFENQLSSVDNEDIYIFAAGESGSSAEYWRHKFVRGLEGGKENSRTLKSFDNEKQRVFWDKKVIIFVDDIIGSGEQFIDFTERFLLVSNQIQDRFTNSRIIYFTPVATEHGIKEISNYFRDIIELYHGKLVKKIFDENNDIWKKSTILPSDKIEEICLKYGKRLNIDNEHLLGHRNSQLLIAFQDHTPDNTIPLLWHKTSDWNRLLER